MHVIPYFHVSVTDFEQLIARWKGLLYQQFLITKLFQSQRYSITQSYSLVFAHFSHNVSGVVFWPIFAKWLSIQILRLFRARSSLTFRQP